MAPHASKALSKTRSKSSKPAKAKPAKAKPAKAKPAKAKDKWARHFEVLGHERASQLQLACYKGSPRPIGKISFIGLDALDNSLNRALFNTQKLFGLDLQDDIKLWEIAEPILLNLAVDVSGPRKNKINFLRTRCHCLRNGLRDPEVSGVAGH